MTKNAAPRLGPGVDAPLSRRAALARIGTLAALVLAVAPVDALASGALGVARGSRPFPHPEPRERISAAAVLPVERLPADVRVRDAYAAARQFPAIFDGLYCACRCLESHGHRSLLSCFESDQPTGCAGCQDEAILAGRHAVLGESLASIRATIDKAYG